MIPVSSDLLHRLFLKVSEYKLNEDGRVMDNLVIEMHCQPYRKTMNFYTRIWHAKHNYEYW